MSPALQMPYGHKAAEEIGPRLFRKQILRVGEIPYKGERLRFDRAYLEQAVSSFKAGAMDQVPFVLADDDNQHPATPRDRNPNGPERYRGEVKALELSGDGIDAIVELTEEGAELVRKNPKLGVSARLVPDVERDGRRFPVVVEHVCGTLNPRVHGLRPWESVSVRSLSQTSDQEVIDLSDSDYMADQTFTADHLDKLNELPEDQRAQVEALLSGKSEPTGEAKPEPKADDDASLKDRLKKIFGVKAAEETDFDEEFAKLLADAEQAEEEPAAVTASLSDDDRRRIDLAESRAREADLRVAAAEWKAQRAEYEQHGVPPVLLDLAEPILKTGPKHVLDLSDSEQADAGQVIRDMLDATKGVVDLSDPSGTVADESEESEAREMAKRWKENPA